VQSVSRNVGADLLALTKRASGGGPSGPEQTATIC